MLEVQKYLQTKTLDDLNKEYGVNITYQDGPLVILNYDQIESPKSIEAVKECRGLVLNKEDKSLVARSFPRFFNIGEMADELEKFNWNDFAAQEKIDGSLCLFYNFDGEWRVNTRGSFGSFPILDADWKRERFAEAANYTWRDAILHGMGIKSLKELNGVLDPALTYVGEFTSLWNKVVRDYPTPKVHLLTRFAGEEEIGGAIEIPLFQKVQEYPLRNLEDIKHFVEDHPESTFEGVVIKDNEYRRWKCKNSRYLSYHKMKGANGDGLYMPKNLIPFILSGEEGELLAIYPEIRDYFLKQKEKVDSSFAQLQNVWEQNYKIENQKEFALAIKGKTSFTGLLFQLRKELGVKQSLNDLKKYWRNSSDTILKFIFNH